MPSLRCIWKPSGFGSNIIKQSLSETCLLARDALSAWISSIPKFLRQVLWTSPLKSFLNLVPALYLQDVNDIHQLLYGLVKSPALCDHDLFHMVPPPLSGKYSVGKHIVALSLSPFSLVCGRHF